MGMCRHAIICIMTLKGGEKTANKNTDEASCWGAEAPQNKETQCTNHIVKHYTKLNKQWITKSIHILGKFAEDPIHCLWSPLLLCMYGYVRKYVNPPSVQPGANCRQARCEIVRRETLGQFCQRSRFWPRNENIIL